MINNFIAGKGYGFIDGDDGKSYFFHIKDFVSPLPDDVVEEGVLVEFDPTPSPKGLRANKVRALGDSDDIRYIIPDSFMVFKRGVPKAWKVLESSQWKVEYESPSMDDAENKIIKKASSLGANAISELKYSIRRGSRGTHGGGTYHFSLHCFEGRPLVIAKPSMEGMRLEEINSNLNSNCQIDHSSQKVSWVSRMLIRAFASVISLSYLLSGYGGSLIVGVIGFVGFVFLVFKITSRRGAKLFFSPEK